MPTRDSTGKRLSGAAQRKRQQQIAERERQREGDGTTGFEQLEPPDLNETASLITWAAKGLALTAFRALSSPDIFDAESTKLRFVADCFVKIGMVRDKATEQEEYKRLKRKLKGEEQKASTSRVLGETPPRVSRPT